MKVGTVVEMANGAKIRITAWDENSNSFSGAITSLEGVANEIFLATRGVGFWDNSWGKYAIKGVVMPEGKLKVFLKAVGNTVIFKVLEQDESLQAKIGGRLHFCASNGMMINSVGGQTLSPLNIYLKGADSEPGGDVATLRCDSDQEARDYVAKAKAALKEFAANNYFEGRTLETPSDVDPDIFWV